MSRCDLLIKITSIVVAMLCVSCNYRVENREQSQVNAQPTTQPNIVYGDLIIKQESDYLMIPVSILTYTNQGGKNKGNLYSGSLSRSYKDRKDIYNLIFYSKKDASTNALLNKKAIIKSFDLIEKNL